MSKRQLESDVLSLLPEIWLFIRHTCCLLYLHEQWNLIVSHLLQYKNYIFNHPLKELYLTKERIDEGYCWMEQIQIIWFKNTIAAITSKKKHSKMNKDNRLFFNEKLTYFVTSKKLSDDKVYERYINKMFLNVGGLINIINMDKSIQKTEINDFSELKTAYTINELLLDLEKKMIDLEIIRESGQYFTINIQFDQTI
jgi:hypothetical protein